MYLLTIRNRKSILEKKEVSKEVIIYIQFLLLVTTLGKDLRIK